MTKEDYQAIADENRLSALKANHGDPLCDLMCEVYWAGYEDGYLHAVEILRSMGPRLAGCGMNNFMKENMEKIHRRVDAINSISQDGDSMFRI